VNDQAEARALRPETEITVSIVLRKSFSIRPDNRAATDIHPLLQAGLVGGFPAILLVLWLEWCLFWGMWRLTRANMSLRKRLLPYLAVLAVTGLVVNTIGAGGTLAGTGLIAMAAFVGLMAAEAADQKVASANLLNSFVRSETRRTTA